jgi:hypothetical protein
LGTEGQLQLATPGAVAEYRRVLARPVPSSGFTHLGRVLIQDSCSFRISGMAIGAARSDDAVFPALAAAGGRGAGHRQFCRLSR